MSDKKYFVTIDFDPEKYQHLLELIVQQERSLSSKSKEESRLG